MHRKVVILGIDGVPYTLLEEYRRRGIMPELDRLAGQGSLVQMKSTLPEISSVAWTSFMTGVNPGSHGIFGFMELNPSTYDYTFPNFTSLAMRPFWERHNIRTVALNIPQTYPAVPMNGAMVSGFVALDLKKASYPEHVYQYLSGIGYAIDVNAKLAQENTAAFFENLFATFEKRKQAIDYFFEHEDWQLFIGTITETDRLHHFFFDSAREGEQFPVFERFYRSLDAFIGHMAERAKRAGALFLTCSDHGFTTIKREVFVNTWLRQNGYLSLEAKPGLKGILPETTAFCLDPSRLYLHEQGRYSRGKVTPAERTSLLKKLRESLASLTFENEPVVDRIFEREEIFKGPSAGRGPELYLLPRYGFDLKGATNREQVFGTSHFKGMHTYDDAHLFCSEKLPQGVISNLCIENVADIVLDSTPK